MTYESSISNLCEVNSSFDSGLLRVAYHGDNRNGSRISKESFERCIKTIYNCPIVCNYDRDSDEIGAHDIILSRNSDGMLKMVNVTEPIGVVPESAKYFWEPVVEDNGVEHEYLCVDVLLWKRQEAYEKVKNNGITAESMEITVKDGGMKDGVFVINDFEFTAFCLLGSAEPCFESASLAVFAKDSFKQQLDEMMQDFKAAFSIAQPPAMEVDTYIEHSEGGETLEEKIALMAEYHLTSDDIDFNLEDFSIDELREKFEAIAHSDSHEEETDEPEDDAVEESGTGEPEEAQADFKLAGQILDSICEALASVKIETEYGLMTRYCFVDYDAERGEVYCYDWEDWRLYAFSYSMNGDNVVIDFESKKRMKFDIVEFDEGEQRSPMGALFEVMSAAYKKNNDEWASKYGALETQIQEASSKIEELQSFKANVEQNAKEAEREEVFSNFPDLAGIEAFEELRNNCDELSAEEVEEKCFAIRGRNQPMKFGFKGVKSPKLPVGGKNDAKARPYGGLFDKYGVNASNEN